MASNIPEIKASYPIEMQSCSTWALSGDESCNRDIHDEFSRLTEQLQENQASLGKNIQEQRVEAMRQISALRDPTEYKVKEIYLCGCYMSEEDVVPSHYWIEDHSNGFTTDTFINRDSAVVVFRVGDEGQDFQPGCEGEAIDANQIVRVRIDGYTKGQVDILTNYSRPEIVVNEISRLKKSEIESSQRACNGADGANYILQHLDKYPHRNNPKNIKQLKEDVEKLNNKIEGLRDELKELEQNPPVKPKLPESEDGYPIDVTKKDNPIFKAMQGALQARKSQEKKEEVREPRANEPGKDVSAQRQNRSLLRSLHVSLNRFGASVALVTLAVAAISIYSARKRP